MKNIYKHYLKKVDSVNYIELYSDLVGICYKLNYNTLASEIDKTILSTLM